MWKKSAEQKFAAKFLWQLLSSDNKESDITSQRCYQREFQYQREPTTNGKAKATSVSQTRSSKSAALRSFAFQPSAQTEWRSESESTCAGYII